MELFCIYRGIRYIEVATIWRCRVYGGNRNKEVCEEIVIAIVDT